MLAAEGDFAGLIQRGKGAAGKFTGIAGNVCWEGAAAALGKLKVECLAPWQNSNMGFPFEGPTYFRSFLQSALPPRDWHEGSTAERNSEDKNQLDRIVISTGSLLSTPSL